MPSALNRSLLQSLTNIASPQVGKLYRLLQARDFAGLKTLFHAFYASIANDWYRKNELSCVEFSKVSRNIIGFEVETLQLT